MNGYEALLLSHAKDNYMRRVDLARKLELTASGVTRLLDGLEEDGLVEKATCPSDARVTYAVPDDGGEEEAQAGITLPRRGDQGAVRGALQEAGVATLAELLATLPS